MEECSLGLAEDWAVAEGGSVEKRRRQGARGDAVFGSAREGVAVSRLDMTCIGMDAVLTMHLF